MGCSCCESKVIETIAEFLNDDELICYCENVTVGEVKEAIKNGAKSVKDVADATGACKSANRCEDLNPHKRCCAVDIMKLIDETLKS